MLARGTAWVLAAALLGAAETNAAPAHVPVTPELKKRLVQAMAEESGFRDRFDAEVWLVDMSQRLSRRIPDGQRRLQLLRHVHREATRTKLEPELVLALIQVESNFDRFAISEAGARGLMQVMPFWLDEIGRADDNLFDMDTNLRMGCTILRYYLDMEKGNLTRALARYNGSTGKTWYPDRVYRALRTSWQP